MINIYSVQSSVWTSNLKNIAFIYFLKWILTVVCLYEHLKYNPDLKKNVQLRNTCPHYLIKNRNDKNKDARFDETESVSSISKLPNWEVFFVIFCLSVNVFFINRIIKIWIATHELTQTDRNFSRRKYRQSPNESIRFLIAKTLRGRYLLPPQKM